MVPGRGEFPSCSTSALIGAPAPKLISKIEEGLQQGGAVIAGQLDEAAEFDKWPGQPSKVAVLPSTALASLSSPIRPASMIASSPSFLTGAQRRSSRKCA